MVNVQTTNINCKRAPAHYPASLWRFGGGSRVCACGSNGRFPVASYHAGGRDARRGTAATGRTGGVVRAALTAERKRGPCLWSRKRHGNKRVLIALRGGTKPSAFI